MNTLSKYLSLVKFSHTIFALPFALVGFFMAIRQQPQFDWYLLLYVILCMVFARNAAMGFNRYLDRDIDKENPRTAVREIPAGLLSPKSVLLFVIINSIAFVTVTYFINTLTLLLSPVALLVVLGYSYTKRFTSLCHFVLGAGLALAPIGAYLAVTAQFDTAPLLFSFVVFFWVSGFDIIYALQDEEFDKEKGLSSVPSILGKERSLQFSEFLHLLTASLLVTINFIGEFSDLYWIGVAAFVGLLAYQHTLVKPNDLSKVNLAFFTTNGIASVVFASITILSMYY